MRMKDDYIDLAYVLSSVAAMVVFSASFALYFLYKRINVYLIAFGLFTLTVGFFIKKRIDKSDKK